MAATPPPTRDVSPSHKASTRVDGQYHRLKFAQQAQSDWQRLQTLKLGASCVIDGNSLDIADVVAVAKHGVASSLSADPLIQERIDQSIGTLHKHLQAGHLVYGVTTGFGGSADARTTDTEKLQKSLIQHQNSGVLTNKDRGVQSATSQFDDHDSMFDTQSMPTSWVRASMLVRCNSIVRGHSGVRRDVAETILSLLRHDITPVIPLRGSISASGDLSPLSYIAGAIEGSPDIFVRVGKGTNTIITAKQALEEAQIEPIVFRAKEGLGLLNGTAVSAATASLALYQSQEVALLSQLFTAMATEALQGSAESFHPRIAEMRPHPGQIESAANILACLGGSKLARCVSRAKDTKMVGLYQDRYALRTSSQWIAPQLEDLHHAHEQLCVELNSTTDNPLIDFETDHILHGGNFQAAVVTSTMDRTRLALDKLGRMLFAQATEIINPSTNNGLPANLVSDDPSLSSTCKGVDINIASYASELAFLANPVGSHVMSAEMHNQSLNSIALISSRYTFQALDTIRILSATFLFIVCQALDLRVRQVRYFEHVRPALLELVEKCFSDSCAEGTPDLKEKIWSLFVATWSTTMTYYLTERTDKLITAFTPVLIPNLRTCDDLKTLHIFTTKAPQLLKQIWVDVEAQLQADRQGIVSSYLGRASKALYTLVRSPAPAGLGVPFHQGLIEHPTMPKPEGWSQAEADERKTVGSRVSVIYEAMRAGRVHDVVMGVVTESLLKH